MSIPVVVRSWLPCVGTPAKPGVAMTTRVATSMMLTLPAGSLAGASHTRGTEEPTRLP